MTLLVRRLIANDLVKLPRRLKHGPNHWATLRKKVATKDKALQHFDDFYQSVYGQSWANIRAALLKKKSKYVAIINNFGDTEQTVEALELMGAINLQSIYKVHKNTVGTRKETVSASANPNEEDSVQPKLKEKIKNVLSGKRSEELQAVYPEDYEPPQTSLEEASEGNTRKKLDVPLQPTKMRPLEEDLDSALQDQARIIKPSLGLTSSSLHEYIPATKIKGLDDWLLESDHYSFYNRGADFSVTIEKDPVLNIPEHLRIYTFEARNESRFPAPRRGMTGLYNYYLMDGGSIFPVLALDLQPGDTVLDMCAAPGGKSLVALQTLFPRVLVANDSSESRMNRITDVMSEYFGNLGVWDGRLFITHKDGRQLTEMNTFNKILVDVPCTTDRHVLHEDDNNIFKPTRLRERLQLPELQSELLSHALKIVAPGGTVVYSTCSLSPIQNDGVVQMALKKTWEETQSVLVVMDMMEALDPLRCLYKFGNFGLKYGHIVIPSKANNWGPMYFCKIVRVR